MAWFVEPYSILALKLDLWMPASQPLRPLANRGTAGQSDKNFSNLYPKGSKQLVKKDFRLKDHIYYGYWDLIPELRGISRGSEYHTQAILGRVLCLQLCDVAACGRAFFHALQDWAARG